MNRKISSIVLSAALGFGAMNAHAVAYTGQNEFLGTFPMIPNGQVFDHLALDLGTFSEYWIFQISSLQGGEGSVNFTPSAGITGFGAEILSLASATGCSVAGDNCSSIGAETFFAAFLPDPIVGLKAVGTFTTGYYAIRVFGNNLIPPTIDGTSTYSGQITFKKVPEPGSLALLGLGLIGLGAARRRKA